MSATREKRVCASLLRIKVKPVLGVRITFLDRYNPDEFQLISIHKGNVNGKAKYSRILTRRR